MSKRGVVITRYRPLPADSKNFGISINGLDFSPYVVDESLRRYALYWDQIEYPNNNSIYIGSSSDVSLLESAGVLVRTHVDLGNTFDSSHAATYELLSQVAAFQKHEAEEPGCWQIAQEGQVLHLPNNLAVSKRVAVVELNNALPEPDPRVPLEKVLEFKDKRSSELIAFRNAMDQLYDKIHRSADIPRARQAAVTQIERSILDIKTVMDESFISRFLRTMKVEIGLGSIATSAAAGAHLVSQYQMPLLVASAASGLYVAGSTMKFVLTSKPILALSESKRDFAYLYYAEKELQKLA